MTTRLHQIVKKIYVLCILGKLIFGIARIVFDSSLGTTRLSLSMDCPNLHKHNYENHCMNMQLELQKLMHKLRLEDSN